MEKQLNEFVKDWNINATTDSATHINTGLDFKYIPKDDKGRENVEIGGMPKWLRNCSEQGINTEQSKEILNGLVKEFVQIHKEVIVPQKFNTFMQTKGRSMD